MNDGSILEIDNVTKDFGGLRAIDRCSLQVGRGTITGLIGPNGAGKTTLFNVITGLLKPDGGHIRFEGSRVDGLSPHQIFHKGLVRTFQVPRELKGMTVIENLLLVPAGQLGERVWWSLFAPGAMRRQERESLEAALEVLDFVDLLPLKDEYAGNLSSGQKKLLELARTLMAEPKLVLLDEPGAGVNPVLMEKLVNYIELACVERDISFFLIEHDMDLVARLCNPVIVMSDGRKMAEGTLAEIRRNDEVLEAYLGGGFQ